MFFYVNVNTNPSVPLNKYKVFSSELMKKNLSSQSVIIFFFCQVNCFHCCQVGRHLLGDGTIQYEDGDRTQNKATKSRCGCGYKHYYKGKEYDNLPEQ